VLSQRIVRQRDPLRPLLFALTLPTLLEQVAQLHFARPLAFADNTFLQGAPALALEAFDTLLQLAAPLGLQVALANCSLYSIDAPAAASDMETLNNSQAQDGLRAAGTAVGSPSFEAAKANSCADSACALVDELAILPLGEQHQWLVLHGSLQQRVAHLPRGGAWE
jgi:hypothetical protein